MYKFGSVVYDTMIDNDELWWCLGNGNAMLVNDGSLMDC